MFLAAHAVVLALDSAKKASGASILHSVPGREPRLIDTGVVKTREQRKREGWVVRAKTLAAELELPLAVIGEEWDKPRHKEKTNAKGETTRFDQKWTYPTILGMGEGWGWWSAEFMRHDIVDKQIMRVTPLVWRNDLFGRKNRARETREAKQQAVDYVLMRYQIRVPHDAAESVCIGLWGVLQPRMRAIADSVSK